MEAFALAAAGARLAAFAAGRSWSAAGAGAESSRPKAVIADEIMALSLVFGAGAAIRAAAGELASAVWRPASSRARDPYLMAGLRSAAGLSGDRLPSI